MPDDACSHAGILRVPQNDGLDGVPLAAERVNHGPTERSPKSTHQSPSLQSPFSPMANPAPACYTSPMIHENLSQAIEDLSSRMRAIRDSL